MGLNEEFRVGLLYYSEGPEWGVLPQVRLVSILLFFLSCGRC